MYLLDKLKILKFYGKKICEFSFGENYRILIWSFIVLDINNLVIMTQIDSLNIYKSK